MSKILTLCLGLSFFIMGFLSENPDLNAQCPQRYLDQVFSEVDVTRNIIYASKKQSNGQNIDLTYDVYQPHGDTFSLRPVMFLIHGGGFIKGLGSMDDMAVHCNYFAQRGYVTVSVEYRMEPNVLSVLFEDVMVKAMARGMIDTKDAINHLVSTRQFGNPYRIDTSKIIIGGVSAGAINSLLVCYLDSIQMLQEKYQRLIAGLDGIDVDSMLRHRFDYFKPKVLVSISGMVLDTNWIKPNGIDVLLVHGNLDEIVPYNYGRLLTLPWLPNGYGAKAQYPRIINQGIRCEFEDWTGRGHVPFQNNFTNPFDPVFYNQPILDSMHRHIAHFCFKVLNYDQQETLIHQNIADVNLFVFPNPSKGDFTIQIPEEMNCKTWHVSIYDMLGKEQFDQVFEGINGFVSVNEKLTPGVYLVRMSGEKDKNTVHYTAKITIAK
jgi:acetyl esterase/lipase